MRPNEMKQARLERGITLEQMSDAVRYSKELIEEIENGVSYDTELMRRMEQYLRDGVVVNMLGS
jgi:transcriptional regulator with XRE-family HTH domain